MGCWSFANWFLWFRNHPKHVWMHMRVFLVMGLPPKPSIYRWIFHDSSTIQLGDPHFAGNQLRIILSDRGVSPESGGSPTDRWDAGDNPNLIAGWLGVAPLEPPISWRKSPGITASPDDFPRRVLFQANPASTPLSDSLSDTEAAYISGAMFETGYFFHEQ